jgi:PAS domain S-box-containing protein
MRVIPLIVFLILSAVTLLVWHRQVDHERALVLGRSHDVSFQASRRLQIMVAGGLTAGSLFGEIWARHEGTASTRKRFQELAPILLAKTPGIHDVRLVSLDDTNGWRARDQVDSSWPRLGAARPALLRQAHRLREAVLSEPVSVGADRARYFAAIPLPGMATALDTLVIEFDTSALIDSGFKQRTRRDFSFVVSDSSSVLYAHHPDGALAHASPLLAEQVFPVRNRTWRLTLGPRPALLAGVGWAANFPIPLLGFTLSGGLSVLLFLKLRRLHLFRLARDRALSEVWERQRAEEALRASEARFRSVFDTAAEGLIVIDDDDRIVEANPVACRMHGYAAGELDGVCVRDLIAENSRDTLDVCKQRCANGETPRCDSVHVRRNGTRFDVEVRASALPRDLDERLVLIVTDVTERQRTILRLGQLSRKIMMAQEEERSRVSRELHDELGQLLTAARLELSWLRKQAPINGQQMEAIAAQSTHLVEQAADELRRICRGLRPPVLDDLGLEPAAVQLTREFRERTSANVQLIADLEDDVALPAEAALCVYRVLQESLNNVSRHSEASNVTVRLVREAGAIELEVSDDGVGFDADQAEAERGFGVAGMQERASLVGGRLSISSRPGSGTKVSLHLPVAGAPS